MKLELIVEVDAYEDPPEFEPHQIGRVEPLDRAYDREFTQLDIDPDYTG